MYTVDVSNIKKERTLPIILLTIGLIAFVALGIATFFIARNQMKLTSSTQSYRTDYTTGKNDEGTNMYSAIYYYRVEGKEYVCKPGLETSNKPTGENVTIFYNPNNPSECSSSSLRMFYIVMCVLYLVPIVFTTIAIFNFRSISNKIKKRQELGSYGKLIRGLQFETLTSGTYINGRNVPQIMVKYQMPDGTISELISDLRYDMIDGVYGQTVDLLIDENDPTNYYIDFNIN